MKKLVLIAASLIIASVLSSCTSDRDSGSAVFMLRPHYELPEEFSVNTLYTTVFLAGTIDMGSGEDWQADMLDYFSALPGRYVLYNPRQENWDATRPGEMDYQVNWELEHLEKADYIIMNILPDSKSPITLLELGLFARSGKLFVSCPPEFYRYDNVRITCSRYGVPLFHSLEDMLEDLSGRL